jgi:hypothetical protein
MNSRHRILHNLYYRQAGGEAARPPEPQPEKQSTFSVEEVKRMAREAEHTPGPWGIGLNPTIPEGQQIEAYSEDGNRVLQVIVRTFNPDDLHLIAAAPDLLEMLQEIVGKGLLNGAMLKDARSVIAKATGGQA